MMKLKATRTAEVTLAGDQKMEFPPNAEWGDPGRTRSSADCAPGFSHSGAWL